MKFVEKITEHGTKIKALAISAVVGVTAFSGTALLDDSAEGPQDIFSEEEVQNEGPKEISNQVDENTEKLDSLAGKNNSQTDYRVMGC